MNTVVLESDANPYGCSVGLFDDIGAAGLYPANAPSRSVVARIMYA
jgi:hypothetical protein